MTKAEIINGSKERIEENQKLLLDAEELGRKLFPNYDEIFGIIGTILKPV